MTRQFRFILCLFASLLLIPIHSDCSEVLEFEQEAEIECVETHTQESVSVEITESKALTVATFATSLLQPCRIQLPTVSTPRLWIKFLTFIE